VALTVGLQQGNGAMFARASALARACGPAMALLCFVAIGIGSAWLIGLRWVAIGAGLASITSLVFVAHLWGQVEHALAKPKGKLEV
jgi:hypothetical protein